MSFNARFLDARQNEVQRQSHFKIAIDGFSEEFLLHVRTSSLVSKTFTPIETRFFNDLIKQAGSRTFDDLALTIHDAIGPDVERQLYNWQELIMNSTTGYMGYAADYKRTATITEYNINGEIRSVWEFEGVWPTNINFGDLTREDVNKKSVTVTLAYDRARLKSMAEV